MDSLLLRRRVLTLACRSESDLATRVGTAMATRVMDMATQVGTAMATRVMDMGIIRMGIIDRIHTTAGVDSITATVVITTAIGTKLT